MFLEMRDRALDRIDERLAVILTGSLTLRDLIASFTWARDIELDYDVIDITLPNHHEQRTDSSRARTAFNR